jgi:hypothetical protein
MTILSLLNTLDILDIPFPRPLNYIKDLLTCSAYEITQKEFLLPTIDQSEAFFKKTFSTTNHQRIKRVFEWFISGPLRHFIRYTLNYSYLFSSTLLKPLSYTQIAKSYINLYCLDRLGEILDVKTTKLLRYMLFTSQDKEIKKFHPMHAILICVFKFTIAYPLRLLRTRAYVLDTGLFCSKDLKKGMTEAIENLRLKKFQRNLHLDFYKGGGKYFVATLVQSLFDTLIEYYHNPAPRVPLRIVF